MKKVLLLSAAVLAMTACSNTDVIEEGALQQTNAIGFQSMVNKGSRALDATNFSNFYVYGSYLAPNSVTNRIPVFEGEEVTKGADGTWSYGEGNALRYWVKDGKYKFYAYSNDGAAIQDGEGTIGFGSISNGILNIRDYIADNTHQKDLVFVETAEIAGQDKGSNNPVSLEFKHVLARIKATFKSEFPAGYKVHISDVKVSGHYTKGDYVDNNAYAAAKSTHSWIFGEKPTTGNASLNFEGNNGIGIATAKVNDTPAVDASTSYTYVLPNDYDGKNIVSINFKMEVFHGDDLILGRTMKVTWAPKWLEHHQYNYNIVISGKDADLDPIQFTASVGGWDDGQPTIGDSNLEVNYDSTVSE